MSVRLPTDQHGRLLELADKLGTKMNELLVEAVARFLATEEPRVREAEQAGLLWKRSRKMNR
jgi:predicted transcriptional regulator